MFKRDYKIIISADVNDTTYWQLLMKGEQAACNEQEIRMVSQILGELKAKIDKQYDNKKANVNNPEELSHSEMTKISDQEEPVSNDFEMALAEMIGNAQTSVVEPWVIAAQWKDELIKLAKNEEPISDELEEAATKYAQDKYMPVQTSQAFKAGAKWKEANLWKPADGDDLPDIDREVIALTQPFPDDDEHLRVVFAHRPNKYANVWNSDLGEEQVVEIERHDKGGWNIPDVKWWLDCSMPK